MQKMAQGPWGCRAPAAVFPTPGRPILHFVACDSPIGAPDVTIPSSINAPARRTTVVAAHIVCGDFHRPRYCMTAE
jgi:hypothetical protein